MSCHCLSSPALYCHL